MTPKEYALETFRNNGAKPTDKALVSLSYLTQMLTNYGEHVKAEQRKESAQLVNAYFHQKKDGFYSSVVMYPDDMQDLMNDIVDNELTPKV